MYNEELTDNMTVDLYENMGYPFDSRECWSGVVLVDHPLDAVITRGRYTFDSFQKVPYEIIGYEPSYEEMYNWILNLFREKFEFKAGCMLHVEQTLSYVIVNSREVLVVTLEMLLYTGLDRDLRSQVKGKVKLSIKNAPNLKVAYYRMAKQLLEPKE